MKIVEDHYDDLGEDLSGLPGIQLLLLDVRSETIEAYVTDVTDKMIENLIYWFPLGASANIDTTYSQSSLESSFQTLFLSGSGIDLCELCGGVGRPTQIAVRRRLRTGENFDLVTGFDLGNAAHQQHILHYVNTNRVLVVIMAPSCRTLGPPSNLNQQLN